MTTVVFHLIYICTQAETVALVGKTDATVAQVVVIVACIRQFNLKVYPLVKVVKGAVKLYWLFEFDRQACEPSYPFGIGNVGFQCEIVGFLIGKPRHSRKRGQLAANYVSHALGQGGIVYIS